MKRAISMIALVITVVVLIIITATIILSMNNNNMILKADEAVFRQTISTYQEELQKYLLDKKIETLDNYNKELLYADNEKITYDDDTIDGNIFNIVPLLKDSKYESFIKIEKGELFFYSENEQERLWAQGIINLGDIVRILDDEELRSKILLATAPNDQAQVSNNIIAIDAWGKSVNLDLWNYSFPNSTTAAISYKGSIVEGKILGEIPTYIKLGENLYKVTNLTNAFKNKRTLVEAPYIPNTVVTLYDAFYNCSSMIVPPVIPSSVTTMQGTFLGCTSLNGKIVTINAKSGSNCAYAFSYVSNVTIQGEDEIFLGTVASTGSNIKINYTKYTAKDILGEFVDINKWRIALNNNETASLIYGGEIVEGKIEGKIPSTIIGPDTTYTVTNLTNAFKNRTTLIEAPEIPSTVVTLYDTFSNCSSMIVPPEIPSSVRNMQGAFLACRSLNGKTVVVKATSGTVTAYAFNGVSGVKLEGPDETILRNLAGSGSNITYTVTQ